MFESYEKQINGWCKALDEKPETFYKALNKIAEEIKNEPIYSNISTDEIEELAIRDVYSTIKYDLDHPTQYMIKKLVEPIAGIINETQFMSLSSKTRLPR